MTKQYHPQTFLDHPNVWRLKSLLEKLFVNPVPEQITEALSVFFKTYPIPKESFPLLEGTYSRTILYRTPSGYEAMAARWSPGTVSSIHGHPHFALILVTEGELEVDYYEKQGPHIVKTKSGRLSEHQFFSDIGPSGQFDNHIHQVKSNEETFSIHISSDDAAKGETFGSDLVLS